MNKFFFLIIMICVSEKKKDGKRKEQRHERNMDQRITKQVAVRLTLLLPFVLCSSPGTTNTISDISTMRRDRLRLPPTEIINRCNPHSLSPPASPRPLGLS
jgi:hypothetical protein